MCHCVKLQCDLHSLCVEANLHGAPAFMPFQAWPAALQEAMTAKLESMRVTAMDDAESCVLASQHLSPASAQPAMAHGADSADFMMQRSLRSVRTPRNTLQKFDASDGDYQQGVDATKLQDQLLQLGNASSDVQMLEAVRARESTASTLGASASKDGTLDSGKTQGLHSYKPGGSGRKKGGLKSVPGACPPILEFATCLPTHGFATCMAFAQLLFAAAYFAVLARACVLFVRMLGKTATHHCARL